MKQIPSKLMERCTIGPEYRLEHVINKKEYPELPEIKPDLKVLEFDHWK